ncbi:3D domain-containing protein [Paenibacillus sp. NEAU-GSW1]|uniref:3D domain-containing protein n=1 Tax=Paenibacillus sp. NEAU-GSW1 TaxID=2682486 RepID=UPI0012E190C3|nr:3D domain-containing protein [Paenibacillus sp. NEAU-GSW1]MUT67578.1 LysM peptidoglycan-binding domain-containing protein [Paenibacillus sp. NEAU-GSW1]
MKKLSIATAAIGLTLLLAAGPVSAATKTHTAVEGDTFWKLSKKYNVNLTQLMKANAKINPLNIWAGMKITIPSTVHSSAAKKTNTASATTLKAQTVTAANGKIHTFSEQLQVKATAYSAAASENGKWGAVDYFGNPLKVGTIAVDPNVIPLGTQVYITGYDHNGLPIGGMVAKATDTGGAIKGNRIDIFVPGTSAQASNFGIQNVKVYILK